MRFKRINKIVLLATLAALSLNLEKGSFSRHFIPSIFQMLLVVSIVLTIVYVVKENKIKDLFTSVPKKIWWAIGGLYALILIGWAIAIFSVGIPTTLTTILDFGTFTIGIVLFMLVSFYTDDDRAYALWCLYAIMIPNLHLLYYYLTHGLVGYWGAVNDFSLDKVLDPNILSKTLIVPTLFFICMALFAWKNNKKWWLTCIYGLLGAIAAMMVFWTVSRGGSVSLVFGAMVTWLVFSIKEFTWKKFFIGGTIVVLILSLGYVTTPHASRQAIAVKTSNTFTLPAAAGGSVANITVSEIQKLPQTESRLLIWYFYPRYILRHPFGVGPNAAHDFNFQDKNGGHIYVGPDSTYLVITLWAGLLGLLVYCYIIWSAFVELWKKWQKHSDATILALMSILFSLSVALFFDGMLSLYWLYVILALAFTIKNER